MSVEDPSAHQKQQQHSRMVCNKLAVSLLLQAAKQGLLMSIYFFTVPSGYPRNPESFSRSPTEIFLTWSEVPPIDQNGVITHYEVVFNSTANAFPHYETITSGTSLSAIVGPLQPFIPYNISVRAYTAVGAGPLNPMAVTTVTDPTGIH